MTLFSALLESQLSQGDLFAPDWDNDRFPREESVIVVSEGCDIEHSDTVLVADTLSEAETSGDLIVNIKPGKVFWAFYLDGSDRWANLRTIRPLDKAPLEERLDRRLHSMLPVGRLALAGKIFSFLTHTLPPRARHFRDAHGVVWDAWEVRPKDIARVEDQLRRKIDANLSNGWLFMTSTNGSRRLAPFPLGWQFLPDSEMTQLLNQALPVDPRNAAPMAIEAAARPVL
jgi:hypothetical protein